MNCSSTGTCSSSGIRTTRTGSRVKYVHEVIGINGRLDALQAAGLRVKLKSLEEWTEGRQRNAARYEALFKQSNLLDCVTLPTVTAENRHVYNQYVIRVQRRDQLRTFLQEQGGGTAIYYPFPLHFPVCSKGLGHMPCSIPPQARRCAGTLGVSLF